MEESNIVIKIIVALIVGVLLYTAFYQSDEEKRAQEVKWERESKCQPRQRSDGKYYLPEGCSYDDIGDNPRLY